MGASDNVPNNIDNSSSNNSGGNCCSRAANKFQNAVIGTLERAFCKYGEIVAR